MPNPNRSNTTTADKNYKQEPPPPPSNNLWIGNLTADTTDLDLLDLFGRYGVVDTVTNYSSRNYAFVYYKRLEDACAAKGGLQNALLRGNGIRIEFARPAKPAKSLWIGGISYSVTKEQLEEEFLKFGKIESFKFLRDRNSALVEYCRLEDAVAAVKTMNARRIGGEQIRVDFLRSQPNRKENWAEYPVSRDRNFNNRKIGPPEPYWESPEEVGDFPEPSSFGHKSHPPSQYSGFRRESHPSKVLWIGYPPSVQIDEQMLHNAMILFGEIERIKSFPSRHYSFVEFRSVDEARRAKEGLQGRLFNDPRIHIMFSSSELAPPKDSPIYFTGDDGPRPDFYFTDPPFGPGPMDFFGHNRPMASNNFPGPLVPNGMPGPNMFMRPFVPQGGFDLGPSGPEMFNELAGLMHTFQDANPNSPMGQNWRRQSPVSGMNVTPSPAPGVRPPPLTRVMPGTRDRSDPKVCQRDFKRSRIDGPSHIGDGPFPTRMMGDQGIGRDQHFGFEPQQDRGTPLPAVQGHSRHGPLGMGAPNGGASDQVHSESDFCWRGLIAKGGTPVCHARCVPIGKGLDSQLPEIVNCSARTGLDMLAKHYTEASSFDIVFFLPDSEDDFASYTEFLHYLGAKNRAGVAKFDDGTTLFLVPPSDFLTKVLNVSGPERLYGVVLKMPHQKPSAPVHPQHSVLPSQFNDRYQLPTLQTEYNQLPPKEDQVLQMGYSRSSHEGAAFHLPRPPLLPIEDSPSIRSVSQDYASSSVPVSQSGLSLTPELIATLALLLPSGMHPPISTAAQLPLGSSALGPTPHPGSAIPDKALSSQDWRQSYQSNFSSTPNHSREDHAVNPSQQVGYHFNPQVPIMSQFSTYSNIANGLDNSGQTIQDNSQTQVLSQNVAHHGIASSRPENNYATHGGQLGVPQQANQLFQFDASPNPQKSYGTGNATDGTGFSQSLVIQQSMPLGTPSTQVQGMNLSQPLLGMSSGNDTVNMVLPDQVQQLQSALSGVGQGNDGEADKNQRYQSTLQFAASLLLQIQQRQQQGNSQQANNSGNHQ